MTTVLEEIKSRGERVTLPRRLVIEALGQAHQHMTIADIQAYMQAHNHQLSDTTIYRVLQWLKDQAVVCQTDIGQSGVVYALIDQPVHHHLVCLNCGEVFTIGDEALAALRERLLQDHDFEARIDHMAIYGHCGNCQPGSQ